MGVSIEVYRIRIGHFYDRSCRCKTNLQIDDLTVLFVNLLILYGTKAVTIALCIQMSVPHNFYIYADVHCDISNNKLVSRMNMTKSVYCIIDHAVCILVPMMIIIILCTVYLLIACDISKNPGPFPSNSDFSNSILNTSSVDSDNNFHEWFVNSCDLSADFKSYLSLIHLNIQSIKPKCDILNAELSEFDILCFTESWLDVTVQDSDVALQGFDVPFRNDRSDRPGGGVIVYCKNNLVCTRRHDLDVRGVECVWIELHLKNSHYLIGTFYRPPNSQNDLWDLIDHSIELAVDTRIKNIIITGDINENQLIHGNTHIKSISTNYSLHQLIRDPTSITETSATLIDVILTNNIHNVAYSKVCEPFLDVNIRYHCPVMCLLRSDKHNSSSFRRKIWLYDKGNYPRYRQMTSEVDWDTIIHVGNSIEINTDNLTNKILELSNKNIPNKIITVRQNDLPWINNEIRKLMRKRNRYRRKAKKSNNRIDWTKFKQLRNKVVALLRSAKSKYFNKLHDKINDEKFGSKDWWKLVKQVSAFNNVDSEIKVLVDSNDQAINDNTDKANLLNAFFASQSTIDDLNKELPTIDSHVQTKIENIIITEQDVTDSLLCLDTSKAYGNDSISPKMLKRSGT